MKTGEFVINWLSTVKCRLNFNIQHSIHSFIMYKSKLEITSKKQHIWLQLILTELLFFSIKEQCDCFVMQKELNSMLHPYEKNIYRDLF